MCRTLLLALAVSVAFAAAQSSSCAATSCPVGSPCVERNGVARCVAPAASNCSIPHEEWRECSSCEATCDNKQPMCNKMCQPASCQCRQGFFRNGEGKCVTENECDIAAGRGRRQTPTNSCANIKCAGGCKDTPTGPVCNGPRPQILPIWAGPSSTEAPRPQILPISAGPSSTNNCSKPNEEWRTCATCEPTCDNKQPMCVMMCQPARCMCRQGFFRNGAGRCVTENECDFAASRGSRDTQTPVTLNACAVTECVTGRVCVEEAGVAKCVERRGRRSTPKISCANVRCAGPCKDTPTGPQCGPRPLILPISAGPSSN